MSAKKKRTILVVEDDNDSRHLICKMLETLGHTPIGFASGKDALAGIVGKNFDLALIDIMMPEMNGYELLAQLREMENWSEAPVIFVTAKDQDSEILEGYNYGADYYITKPFTAKQLEYGIQIVTE